METSTFITINRGDTKDPNRKIPKDKALKAFRDYVENEEKGPDLNAGAIRDYNGKLFLGAFISKDLIKTIFENPNVVGIELRLAKENEESNDRLYNLYFFGVQKKPGEYRILEDSAMEPIYDDQNPPVDTN